MGVAVRAGAPVPDISNVEALKRSLLAAESVVFTRGSSGVYFEALLKKMGLYEQVEGRITRYEDGESAIEHVLKGKGKEVSFGQLTELRLYRDKGLRLIGPLPAEVQNYTVYAGGPDDRPSQRGGCEGFCAPPRQLRQPGSVRRRRNRTVTADSL